MRRGRTGQRRRGPSATSPFADVQANFKMKKLILAIAFLLLSSCSWSTITQLQHTETTGGSVCGGSSGLTCAMTNTATTAGSFSVAVWYWQNTAATIASVTGSCSVPWTQAPGAYQHGSNLNVDIWYCSSSSGGGTSVVATLSAGGSGDFRDSEFLEYTPSAGNTLAFDVAGGNTGVSGSSPWPGVALALSGSNEVIAQAINPSGLAISGISVSGGGTYSLYGLTGSRATGVLLNSTNGAAPNWTVVGIASSGVVSAIAVKEVPGGMLSLSASPASLSVVQGNQGTSTITTTISGGFNSAISLSASGMPSGTTVSFNPNPIPAPGSGNSTMTVTVGSSTPTGTYPITVTGNGGGIQQTATVTLTVAAAPNFTLSAS